jgi:hypothetical protein
MMAAEITILIRRVFYIYILLRAKQYLFKRIYASASPELVLSYLIKTVCLRKSPFNFVYQHHHHFLLMAQFPLLFKHLKILASLITRFIACRKDRKGSFLIDQSLIFNILKGLRRWQ